MFEAMRYSNNVLKEVEQRGVAPAPVLGAVQPGELPRAGRRPGRGLAWTRHRKRRAQAFRASVLFPLRPRKNLISNQDQILAVRVAARL